MEPMTHGDGSYERLRWFYVRVERETKGFTWYLTAVFVPNVDNIDPEKPSWEADSCWQLHCMLCFVTMKYFAYFFDNWWSSFYVVMRLLATKITRLVLRYFYMCHLHDTSRILSFFFSKDSTYWLLIMCQLATAKRCLEIQERELCS